MLTVFWSSHSEKRGNVSFFVTFRNDDGHPLDILRYDQSWNEEVVVKERLDPGIDFPHVAYFNQNFIFKRSDTKDRLKAFSNGVTAIVFEGCRFNMHAGTGSLVIISSGNI